MDNVEIKEDTLPTVDGVLSQPEIDALVRACTGFREIYLSNSRADDIQRDIRTVHLRDNGSSGEAGIVMLVGGPGCGKSMLVGDYAAQFPDKPGAIKSVKGEVADQKDVISFKAPDGNLKNLTETWLSTLTNQQPADVEGRGTRRFLIRADILFVGREVGNRLAIVDEAHQMLQRRDDIAVGQIASFFKDIVNSGGPSLVLAGTSEILRMLAASGELRRRVLYLHTVAELDWNHKEDRDFLLDVLQTWDEHLRDQVFGKLSGLSTKKINQPLWKASGGSLGAMAALVETAAIEAVYDMALAKSDCIQSNHMVRAFKKSPFRTLDQPVFPAALGALPEDETGVQTRLHGRTRRTNRNGNFRR